MKRLIDINKWNRKEHFQFFSKFTEPFYGVTVRVDCTKAYATAKKKQVSFFLYYLFRSLKAANSIDNFKYRIIDGQLYEYDTVNASPTINRPNGTFGFAYFIYYEDETLFFQKALEETDRVRTSTSLMPDAEGENTIHYSAVPWIDFTSISHARNLARPDSCPKISFGKMTETDGVKSMSVSIHVHHALVDGWHVGQFIERFQELMDE